MHVVLHYLPLDLSGLQYADLHSRNISFQIPSLDSWTVEQIYKLFKEPRMKSVSRLDDQPLGSEVPPYTVEAAWPWNPRIEGLSDQVKIIDFGEAFFSEEEERKESNVPMLLQPPESLFHEGIGLPADIWALACTIFEVFGKRSLFEGFMPDPDAVILEMISTLGMLPDRWWSKWRNRSLYLLDDGTRKANSISSPFDEPRPLALRVQKMRLNCNEQFVEDSEQLTAEGAAGLHKVLASLLRYEESERATAEEVVNLIQRLL